ncbi:MAG: hypothetical protein QM765_07905 [Myxococcales bacterium]
MATASRKIVVFDASPQNAPTPWMKKACQSAGVFLAELDAIADLMAKDPEAQKLLVARGPTGPDASLAKHYRAALDTLAAGKTKVAVHSVVWLDYGIAADAAVLDFDNLQLERARSKKLGLTDAGYDALVAKARDQMEARVAKLAPDRVLRLPEQASDARKAELAAAHLSKLLA